MNKKDKLTGEEESVSDQLTKFIEDIQKLNTEDDQYVIQCAQVLYNTLKAN